MRAGSPGPAVAVGASEVGEVGAIAGKAGESTGPPPPGTRRGRQDGAGRRYGRSRTRPTSPARRNCPVRRVRRACGAFPPRLLGLRGPLGPARAPAPPALPGRTHTVPRLPRIPRRLGRRTPPIARASHSTSRSSGPLPGGSYPAPPRVLPQPVDHGDSGSSRRCSTAERQFVPAEVGAADPQVDGGEQLVGCQRLAPRALQEDLDELIDLRQRRFPQMVVTIARSRSSVGWAAPAVRSGAGRRAGSRARRCW